MMGNWVWLFKLADVPQSRCEHLLVLALRNSSSVEENPYTATGTQVSGSGCAVDEGSDGNSILKLNILLSLAFKAPTSRI